MGDGEGAYILDSASELERLERQARVYDLEADVARMRVRPGSAVVDVGCGSGSMARAIARAHPDATVLGVDRDPGYVRGAASLAEREGLSNVSFQEGDLLDLPLARGAFDVVWTKHVLQFVGERPRAVAELRRVARSGGRVIARNFDHFMVDCHPPDPQVQPDIERFFLGVLAAGGFDPRVARKLPHLFHEAGLVDVATAAEIDPVYGGTGPLGAERRWIYEVQMAAVRPLSLRMFDGDAERADAFWTSALAYWSRPDIYRGCILLWVEGTAP